MEVEGLAKRKGVVSKRANRLECFIFSPIEYTKGR